jgi:hypothetical protein
MHATEHPLKVPPTDKNWVVLGWAKFVYLQQHALSAIECVKYIT